MVRMRTRTRRFPLARTAWGIQRRPNSVSFRRTLTAAAARIIERTRTASARSSRGRNTETAPLATGRRDSQENFMRKKRQPNILLIGVDSLRADHMSCYGYPRLTTPHMDRFAQEATLFENT